MEGKKLTSEANEIEKQQRELMKPKFLLKQQQNSKNLKL